MRALIVVESMYGNTRTVAGAVAEGLGAHLPVDVADVAEAPMTIPGDVTLLVVGGPTHAHGMSNPDTRHSAAKRAADMPVPFRSGIREWLEQLAPAPGGLPAAAFDTRIKGPALLWGSAAQGAAKELRRLGFEAAVDPASFLVKGPMGPVFDVLVPGEAERARAWGDRLGAAVIARRTDSPTS
jgi:hypothetical protein